MFNRGPKPDFTPEIGETLNIYSSTVLPKTTFNDPKAVDNLIKAFHEDKIGIDEMSTSINKMRIDPRIIIACAIFIPIGLMLFYQGVISPAVAAEQAYNLKVMENGGNTTGLGPRPPGLAETLRLPGFGPPR